MTTDIRTYLKEGCGRCELGGTPDCKVHTWVECIEVIRLMLTSCGLTEEMKWGAPCYTLDAKNIAMLSALKDACVLGLFKGALLKDPEQLLSAPGPNSQEVRQFRFTSQSDIEKQRSYIIGYIQEAIQIELSGLTVEKSPIPEDIPAELLDRFSANPELQSAFEALTPGRKRGYLIHFNQAKQPATRFRRIEKWEPQILRG